MSTRYFTFAFGERCPVTGEELTGRYATVTTAGGDFEARTAMSAVFGGRWEYDVPTLADAETVTGRKLTRHAALVFGPEDEAADPALPRCMHASRCDQPIVRHSAGTGWVHADLMPRDHEAQPR